MIWVDKHRFVSLIIVIVLTVWVSLTGVIVKVRRMTVQMIIMTEWVWRQIVILAEHVLWAIIVVREAIIAYSRKPLIEGSLDRAVPTVTVTWLLRSVLNWISVAVLQELGTELTVAENLVIWVGTIFAMITIAAIIFARSWVQSSKRLVSKTLAEASTRIAMFVALIVAF